jgi:hypothetical protein
MTKNYQRNDGTNLNIVFEIVLEILKYFLRAGITTKNP